MKPTVARIVMYVLRIDGGVPVIRPAIITAVWSETCVNLTVFQDYHSDKLPYEYCHPTSRCLDPNKGLHTWHWPERT